MAGEQVAASRRLRVLGAVALALAWLGLAAPSSARASGPPFPARIPGQSIYDEAGVLSSSDLQSIRQQADDLRTATGADVVVYLQRKSVDSQDAASGDARALLDQWRVGFDNGGMGVVIVFDAEAVWDAGWTGLAVTDTYATPYLTDLERAWVLDRGGEVQVGRYQTLPKAAPAVGSMLTAMTATGTPDHAAAVRTARLVNGWLLIGSPILALLLVLLAAGAWALRKDPEPAAASPSVLMLAPPPELTPAMAALLMDGRTTTRSVAAGFVDLAARGLVRIGTGLSGGTLGPIQIGLGRNPTSPSEIEGPEGVLYLALHTELVEWRANNPSRPVDLGGGIRTFQEMLEKQAFQRGWLEVHTSRSIGRWRLVCLPALTAGVVVGSIGLACQFFGSFAASSTMISQPFFAAAGQVAVGSLATGASMLVAALAVFVFARWTSAPQLPNEGDTLRTMLAERKEFLARAFHRSGAMDAGEALAALPWVRTAEEAAAWAVAFGLNEQIDRAFDRSLRASGSDLSDKDWYSIWFAPLADSDLFDNLRSR